MATAEKEMPSEVAVPVTTTASIDESPHAVPSRAQLAAAIAGGAAGVVLIAVCLQWKTEWAFGKIGGCLVGMVLVYMAFSRVGRRIAGPRFHAGFWLAVGWIALVAIGALVVDWLPLTEARSPARALSEQTLQRPDLISRHPLGTDRQGLDIFGQLLYGARISLAAGLGSATVGMIVGGLIGLIAGYVKGKFEWVVNLLTDVALAFPPLILLLAMVTIFEPNLLNITLALAFLVVPSYIRLARANTLVFSRREFVLAARVLGAQRRRIIFRELLPNVALPVFSLSFLLVALLIVAEASLSFLGLGIRRPTPTWGNMISAAQGQFNEHPHAVFVPGITLFITVFALNAIGERVRSKWDSRQSVA